MEIHGVGPSNALQAVLAALAELASLDAAQAQAEASAALAGDTGTHGPAGPTGVPSPTLGAGQAVSHGPMQATADSDMRHPDARPDKGAEIARLQNMLRAAVDQPGAAPRGDVDGAPAGQLPGSSDFSLPADQLLHAAVISLQVQPAFAWSLERRGSEPAPQEPSAQHTATPDADHGAEHHGESDADDGEHEGDDPVLASAHAAQAPRSGACPDEIAADDWCEAVTQALRAALRSTPAPRSLRLAVEQWQLGRCVVLACPQGNDPVGPAWAFVLWPRRAGAAAAPLALYGLRVLARLQWARLPPAVDWCHARVMKEQHPRQGRQLVALEARGAAAVACEVQLGPVPMQTPRWREACVRVDAVRRFWAALGEQWSVTVVVGSRPLPGVRTATVPEATCSP